MASIAFLHTAAAHTATFDALLAESGFRPSHAVREDWLRHARLHGIDADLTVVVSRHLRQAAKHAVAARIGGG